MTAPHASDECSRGRSLLLRGTLRLSDVERRRVATQPKNAIHAAVAKRVRRLDVMSAWLHCGEVHVSTCPGMQVQIRVDDLTDPRIADFLEEHLRDMRAVSPPESK